MKNTHSRLLLHACLIPAIMILTNCGGPKYRDGFSKWLSMIVAEQSPISITDVETEETAGGENEIIFQFTATGETTHDLYEVRPFIQINEFDELIKDTKKLTPKALADAGLKPLFQEFNTLAENNQGILHITTPKGSKADIKGKAKGIRKLDSKDQWTYQIIEMKQSPLNGVSEPQKGVYHIENSDSAKEAIAKRDHFVSKIKQSISMGQAIQAEEERVRAVAFEQEKKAAEEKAKANAEKEAAENAKVLAEKKHLMEDILQRVEEGNIYMATWQGTQARGTLGLRFGKGEKLANGYSMEAVLFSPEYPEFSKNISALLTGEGTLEMPFGIELKVQRSANQKESKTYNFRQDSRGFLAADSQFNLQLKYDPGTANFSSTIKNNYMVTFGPVGEIVFLWKKKDAKNEISQPIQDPAVISAPNN